MLRLPPIQALGPRICIFGPSNSGKSTLAQALSHKLDMPAVHLDQLCHFPQTDWQPRPEAEFRALHDTAIQGERWIIEGNYSRYFPQRLSRATGLIQLDVSMPRSLMRYLRRTLFQSNRIGGLDGGQDSLKWVMLRYIVLDPKNSRKHRAEWFKTLEHTKASLPSQRAIAQAYKSWGLPRLF